MAAARLFGRHRTPVVLQTETAECGMACIAMIAGHYGHRLDLPALRRLYDISLKGMTLHDVVRLAHKLSFPRARCGWRWTHLAKLRLPCILHWDHTHFVVLTRVGRRGITIHDPGIRPAAVRLRGGVAALHRRSLWRRGRPTASSGRPSARASAFSTWSATRMASSVPRRRSSSMSLFLEVLVIATPLAFQLVLDEVIVADDQSLLVLIVLGLGLILGFGR